MDAYSYKNPSFSSTLLDAIYRSIDEGDEGLVVYSETMRKKFHGCNLEGDDEMDEFQRVCMIEKWMEEKKNECKKVGVSRRSLADFVPKVKDNHQVFFTNSSSWSSSDSSSGGGFSSSETESVVLSRPESKTSLVHSCYGRQRPKPIRTSVSTQHERSDEVGKKLNMYDDDQGKFVKTKSRALKIYSELKKAKQPISPGGKLANFLNSLFTAKNAKNSERKSKSANASTCSSASSFSRSCLSKTPSSRGKLSNGIKRSVRFYPVSVIVDEDCQPCGHKNLHEEKTITMEGVKDMRNSINEELKFVLTEKNLRVEEAARDLFRNYQKRVEFEYDFRTPHVKNQAFDDEDEHEDDDAASYASSDLFELDNLSAIGNIERYREELPVYETTHLDTNRAIANRMIL